MDILFLLLFVGASAYALGRVDREQPAHYSGSAIADGARALAAAERERRHRASERVA